MQFKYMLESAKGSVEYYLESYDHIGVLSRKTDTIT